MAVNWMDVTDLSFNALLLLEREQISWFPGWVPEKDLAAALKGNPVVAWFLAHKCPEIQDWLNEVRSSEAEEYSPAEIRDAEIAIMRAINDLLVYVIDPDLYDQLPFLDWEDHELTELVDFKGKTVIDIGAGTGRTAFLAAEEGAAVVFAVEPVSNLRRYMREKAQKMDLSNLFTADGIITEIPFPTEFADICQGGHVFGNNPEEEYAEMIRVTKMGGMVILIPGNNDQDEGWHDYLVGQGFHWSRFLEPTDGWKRKYWKTLGQDG
jgi:SAM-dependent methyltransferase